MAEKQIRKSSPYFTWACAADLESRIQKTLFFADGNCYSSMPSATLTDVAVSMYLAAAQSPKRKLEPGYASSLTRKVNVMPCTLMMGILYSERLRHMNPDYLQKISSADLFVVSMLVASKYLVDDGEDDEIFNDQWAEAGGLAVSTVNRLEREFLEALDWRVYVKPNEFFNFCSALETSIALKYGLRRGWFSYTDLSVFLAVVQYKETLRTILSNTIKVIMTCSIFYGFTVVTLFTCVEMLKVAQRLNYSNSTRPTRDAKSDLEPFRNRIITRERKQLEPIQSGNSTVNGLLREHYKPCNTDKISLPSFEADILEISEEGYGIDSLINRIRPCPSPRLSPLKEALDTRIMSLVLSWPHCLQRRPPVIPRKALQSRQMKLGQQELISRFQSKMAKLWPGSRASALVNLHMIDMLRNY